MLRASFFLALLLHAHVPFLTAGGQASQPASVQAASAGEDAPVAVPPPSAQALRYYRSGNLLWLVDVAWGLLVPVVFLFTGLSARIRNWAHMLGRRWFFVVGIYVVLFTLANFLIDLPLGYYEGFVRQHEYGLSTQTFEKWFGDSLKELGIGLVVAFLFAWIPYILLRKSPRRWWLYTSVLALPFMVFAMLVSPVWIDPLFNRFGPMKDKALEARILALAERAGIEGSRVYEVNKSIDTTAVNAYVTGIGGTKRIVLWDTIIAKLDGKELLFVVAHEMGHYVLGHVWHGIVLGSLLVLATLYAAHRLADRLIARYRARWGLDRLSDVASLPLILLLVSVFSLLLSPAVLGFSRYQEHEADRFGLEITRANHSAATGFIKLQQENLSVPRPGWLYKLWRASHPPIGERIDFCNEYRPWQTGRPLRYARHFHQPAP